MTRDDKNCSTVTLIIVIFHFEVLGLLKNHDHTNLAVKSKSIQLSWDRLKIENWQFISKFFSLRKEPYLKKDHNN